MSYQVLTRSTRSPFEARNAERVSIFRRLFGSSQRRRRTYVPLTPDQY